MAVDIVARAMGGNALIAGKAYTDSEVQAIAAATAYGFNYKGKVNTYADLPSTGLTFKDEYMVETATTGYPEGIYVWFVNGDTSAWHYVSVPGPQGIQGIQGAQGNPGFSPVVSVSKSGNISTISIQDATHTATTQVLDGNNNVSVSATGTSSNKVKYITIDGSESKLAQDVIDNTTSTSTEDALSANMGKSLQDQVNNLKNIGRFLSIWDASTGSPSTEPTTSPYSYKVGDYYRVGVAGTKNPANNSTYTTGGTNWVEGESLGVGDVVYISNISGTSATWVKQSSSGGGTVQDVQISGTSIVASGTGIANIPIATVNDSGVIKVGASFNTSTLQSGYMQAVTNSYSQYQGKGNDAFVGKGTLENVLDNEGIRPDKAQSLTDNQKLQARANIAAFTAAEYDSTAASYEAGVFYYTTEA